MTLIVCNVLVLGFPVGNRKQVVHDTYSMQCASVACDNTRIMILVVVQHKVLPRITNRGYCAVCCNSTRIMILVVLQHNSNESCVVTEQ